MICWISLLGSSKENTLELVPLAPNELKVKIGRPSTCAVIATADHPAQSQATSPGNQVRRAKSGVEPDVRADVILDIPVLDSFPGIVNDISDEMSLTLSKPEGSIESVEDSRSFAHQDVSRVAASYAFLVMILFMFVVTGTLHILDAKLGIEPVGRLAMKRDASVLIFLPFVYAGFNALAKFMLKNE